MVGADWRGAQGRPSRGPELHRVRARERDRLPHLHGDGTRSVRAAPLQHVAGADAEAAAGRAARLAQGRVPVLRAEARDTAQPSRSAAMTSARPAATAAALVATLGLAA